MSRRASGGLRPFPRLRAATFVERPNRFLVRCRLGRRRTGPVIDAYLPNPGRLRELLFAGVRLGLVENPPTSTSRTAYTAVAVFKEGRPVMLHTHRTNDVARHLIETGRVPGLEGATVVKAEHKVGHSRFDFLLRRGGEDLLLEVKSCTQFSGRVAMFPDAVTARGARHVLELAELARGGVQTAVLFVVQWPDSRLFAPDYHTDLNFARALLVSRRDVTVIALGIGWTTRLALDETHRPRPCSIPWELIEQEAVDRGSYLLVLALDEALTLPVGALGEVRFPAGFYVYVGSAMANLAKRIERHRRKRKRFHWHIDYLRDQATFVDALPIRATDRLECELAEAVRALSGWSTPGFGASDCDCESHLFGFDTDPRDLPAFQEMLLRFRMDRLETLAGVRPPANEGLRPYAPVGRYPLVP